MDTLEQEVRPLKRVEYDHLVESGFFHGERVELLYGYIICRSAHGNAHAYAIKRLQRILEHAVPSTLEVRVQLPFAALDDSEPEPDLALAPAADYLDDHPRSALLIIEVADSSVSKDRSKGAIYAAAGVAEYWIVNLVDFVVERYTEPLENRYSVVSRHHREESLAVPSLAETRIRIGDFIPPR